MLRFSAFEFDTAAHRLRRGGLDVHLTPKAFELLAALLEAAPRVVSKRELHERLWPGGLVADATLVALVKQLRGALDDRDPDAPLIRTVHRVGYALQVPLEQQIPEVRVPAACWLAAGQRRLLLVHGENIVGRDAAANVRLDDPAVSRRHARIVVGESGTLLEDLGSKNGTFVDGEASTKPVRLRDGNRLGFGTVLVVYRESSAGMPTLTHIG
jgi:DNA-binding winged helix-turn-helix (wHTH) protein